MANEKIKPDNNNVVIRMYNIGFGDCFLLLIPTEFGTKKVLVDCGVHNSGHNPNSKLKDVIKQVIVDVSDETGNNPQIDIVIATHRHQDHVKGFESSEWENVEVGEVWMPWTENYNDSKAVKILNEQSKAAEKAKKAFELMLNNRTRFGIDDKKAEELTAIASVVENNLKNAVAMNTLHHGFKSGDKVKRRYLPFEDRKFNTHQSKLLPGVKVHFMGPSRDEEVIRDMEPSSSEQWFTLIDEMSSDDFQDHLPFHTDWAEKPSKTRLKMFRNDSEIDKLLIEFKEISEIWEGNSFSIAASLEGAVNGTSLMIMFQIGKAYLFFPGDAQNGTWQTALNDAEWRTLLTKTNFYKVGHHGSHNATPKEFVFDVLTADFKAMIPVYPIKKFDKIPKETLVAKLLEKTKDIIRSDKPIENHPDTTRFVRQQLYVETKIPV